MDWKNCKTHSHKAVSSALNVPLLKEVLQNAELLRFWCCQLQKQRQSRIITLFLTLSRSKSCGSLAQLLRFSCCHLQKWRKPCRIASFFDVVKFKNWGSLAELLRFWRCQVQKLRKSRRIAAILMLSGSKFEEVAQSSFVFKLTERQVDR